MLKTIEGVEIDTDLLSKEVVQDDLFRLQRTLLESWSYQMFFDTLQGNCQKSLDEENAKLLTSTEEEIKKSNALIETTKVQMKENEIKLRVAKENVAYLARKIRAYQQLIND